MKVFVIHSGADSNVAESYIKELRDKTTSTEVLMLKNGGRFWKIDAAKKIKQAQLVMIIVGEHSHESKNIEWEINKAASFQKPIVSICIKPDYVLPSALKKTNRYTGDEYSINTDMSLDGLIEYIQSYTNGDYSLFNNIEDEANMKILFEQYKVFLQTSETLVARRQSVSNFYISVNSAIVAVYSAVMSLAKDSSWKYIACLGFPIMGIILCTAWIKILRSYGNLNASKMRIISIIEKKLPASLYDAEWRAQSDKLNSKPYISFTEAEVRIPKLFITIYSLVIVFCLLYLLFTSGKIPNLG